MFKTITILLIGVVSRFFSWNQLRACRYYPTCSTYSIQAFRNYGFFKAFWLMARRVLSCHPFSPGGYQPLKYVVTRKD